MSVQDPPPVFDRHVFCCVNARPAGDPKGCCAAKGSAKLRDYMKARAKELELKRVRINASLCLDRCALGPTMVIYPEGVWYVYRTREDVDEILRTHLVEGRRVARLMLHPNQAAPSEAASLGSPQPCGAPAAPER